MYFKLPVSYLAKFYPDLTQNLFFFRLFYPVRAKAFQKKLPISIRMRIRDLCGFSGVLPSQNM